MKKMVFLSMFISSIAVSQVTDENGTTAVGTSSTTLSGNIGIGLTSPSLPQLMLAIGDTDSGIVGGTNTLGFYTGNTSWLSIDNAGVINVANRLNINHNNLSTYLFGAGITFRNHEQTYGWSEPLIKIESNSGNQYWQLGTYGSAQSYNYGYIGDEYNDKSINWNASNQVGIGLPSSDQPDIMLAIGDSDTGIVGGTNALDFYTGNISRMSIDSDGVVDIANRLNVNQTNMSAYLYGNGIAFRNHYTGGGWSQELLGVEDNAGTNYWALGAYGSGQSHSYGYLGSDYNNKAINWLANNNVGIALPSTNQPNIMLAVGASNTGLIGDSSTLDLVVNNISRLKLDGSGNIDVGNSSWETDLSVYGNILANGDIQSEGSLQAPEINLNQNNNMSLNLKGDGIVMTNHQINGGWARAFLGLNNNEEGQYWELGGYGQGQTHNYGYIGFYDNKAINWTADNNVGIALPSTTAPGIMLAIGDTDTGMVGGTNTLDLYTGNTSKVTINNAGNVGIGTTTPTEKLEVNGTLKATKGFFNNTIPNGAIFVDNNDRVNQTTLIEAGTDSDGTSLLSFMDFPESNFNSKATVRFNIDDRNNESRLRLIAEADGATNFQIFNKLQEPVFSVYENNDWVNVQLEKNDSQLHIGGTGVYPTLHKLHVHDGSAMIEGNILTNSKIGVGVSSADIPADYKMAVAGKIISEEVLVKLQNTWPDYVFNTDYNLPTLQEVEDHIKTNGHLINIPTAKDVEEKGLLLGEMNAKLLEKIEELTLYTIQQQKELEAQKDKNKQLEARLKKIELLLSKSEKD